MLAPRLRERAADRVRRAEWTEDELGQIVRIEKSGLFAGRMNVVAWLRLQSCCSTIGKQIGDRLADRFDTTLQRFNLLAALEPFPDGITMAQLSRAPIAGCENVTTIVGQLADRGMVNFRIVSKDFRTAIISLTDSGRAHLLMTTRAHDAWIKDLFAGMSAQEQVALCRTLGKLKLSIEAESGEREHWR
jgi:DNA-binding MarR family transcriptional regulator